MPLLDPTGSSSEMRHPLAPRRFSSLDGARLGLLGNTKLNADAVLVALGDLLKERYALRSLVVRTKGSFSRPAEDAIVDELVGQCDVIITGVGD